MGGFGGGTQIWSMPTGGSFYKNTSFILSYTDTSQGPLQTLPQWDLGRHMYT